MDTVEVVCTSIDKTFITFECPFCKSRFNKDRKPHKLSKPVFHRHGSNGNLSPRIEYRNPHCSENGKYTAINLGYTEDYKFKIIIS